MDESFQEQQPKNQGEDYEKILALLRMGNIREEDIERVLRLLKKIDAKTISNLLSWSYGYLLSIGKPIENRGDLYRQAYRREGEKYLAQGKKIEELTEEDIELGSFLKLEILQNPELAEIYFKEKQEEYERKETQEGIVRILTSDLIAARRRFNLSEKEFNILLNLLGFKNIKAGKITLKDDLERDANARTLHADYLKTIGRRIDKGWQEFAGSNPIFDPSLEEDLRTINAVKKLPPEGYAATADTIPLEKIVGILNVGNLPREFLVFLVNSFLSRVEETAEPNRLKALKKEVDKLMGEDNPDYKKIARALYPLLPSSEI